MEMGIKKRTRYFARNKSVIDMKHSASTRGGYSFVLQANPGEMRRGR